MNTSLYPFLFEPIFKEKIWGGRRFETVLGKDTGHMEHCGESWELSGLIGDESVISNGFLSENNLNEVLEIYLTDIVGEKNYEKYGLGFPLLIKFIDAHDNLSVQVHPDDELAKQKYGQNGKTEMWYVVDAEPGAHLLAGLTEKITPEQYAAKVADGTITDVLARYEVKPGDVFFLPAGRIHAICGGCFIAEIQQTSNINYRIYDYGRLGLDGKPREVHTELAKDAIDYTVYPTYRTDYTPAKDEEVEVVSCQYFTTSIYDLTLPYAKDLSQIDSFLVVMCLTGSGTIEVDGEEVPVHQGETVLIPAAADDICFVPDGSMKVLTSYIR